MRRKIKLPRILKINWIDGMEISVVYNNGESRIIKFEEVLQALSIDEGSPASILHKPEEFAKVSLVNGTLSWENVEQYITMNDGSWTQVPFEIGPDTLLEFSRSEDPGHEAKLGWLIRHARVKSGLTQEELAKRSGTSRNYISRIENDRSDIELATLRKIVETGLGKTLKISIK